MLHRNSRFLLIFLTTEEGLSNPYCLQLASVDYNCHRRIICLERHQGNDLWLKGDLVSQVVTHKSTQIIAEQRQASCSTLFALAGAREGFFMKIEIKAHFQSLGCMGTNLASRKHCKLHAACFNTSTFNHYSRIQRIYKLYVRFLAKRLIWLCGWKRSASTLSCSLIMENVNIRDTLNHGVLLFAKSASASRTWSCLSLIVQKTDCSHGIR